MKLAGILLFATAIHAMSAANFSRIEQEGKAIVKCLKQDGFDVDYSRQERGLLFISNTTQRCCNMGMKWYQGFESMLDGLFAPKANEQCTGGSVFVWRRQHMEIMRDYLGEGTKGDRRS